MIYEKLNSVGERNLLFPVIVYSMRLVKIDIVKSIFKDLPSPIKSDVMTAYDTLIKEGMEKGIKEGMEKGIQKGMERGIEKGIEKGMERGIKEGMEKGIQKGMERGIEKGMERGIEKAVINLSKKQFDVNQIADIMEINVDKVKNILKKQN